MLIAFRESLNYRILSAQCDANGRYIIRDLETDRRTFILINYHAPPNDECQQLQALEEISNNLDKLDLNKSTQFIWGRDLVLFLTENYIC